MKSDIMDSGLRTQDSGLRTQDSGLKANYARDREYWNNYYSLTLEEISEPSNFARSIISKLGAGGHILDLGCGNGRDSLFFLSNGLHVTGVDASDVAIEKLRRITASNNGANFICGDFVTDEKIYSMKYNYIYSRFTLHAINSSQQDELLRNMKRALSPDGKIFIEARTLRDELYGKGEDIGDNAFIYNGHYRRFIEPENFAGIMRSMGYKIISLCESSGFSKFGDFDPVLMRLTAQV